MTTSNKLKHLDKFTLWIVYIHVHISSSHFMAGRARLVPSPMGSEGLAIHMFENSRWKERFFKLKTENCTLNSTFGDFCALVYVMLYPSTSEDILWVLIYLWDRHVTTEWHISHGFMVIATSYAFVSDFVTLHFSWLVSTSKITTLCFWLPKIIFLPTCFHFNLSICTCL